VVECAARERSARAGCVHGRRHEALVERDRLDPPDLGLLGRAAPLRGRLLSGGAGVGEHVCERAGVTVPEVDEEFRPAGYGGGDPRRALDVPAGADALVPAADLLHGERVAGGGEARVSTHVHRRRAGVGRLALEAKAVTFDAECAAHGRGRDALSLEDGSLLDVEL
jgi:hypothetical protein